MFRSGVVLILWGLPWGFALAPLLGFGMLDCLGCIAASLEKQSFERGVPDKFPMLLRVELFCMTFVKFMLIVDVVVTVMFLVLLMVPFYLLLAITLPLFFEIALWCPDNFPWEATWDGVMHVPWFRVSSQMVRYSYKLAPRGIYTSGKGHGLHWEPAGMGSGCVCARFLCLYWCFGVLRCFGCF